MNTDIAALEAALQAALPPRQHIDVLNALALALTSNNTTRARALSAEALQLAQSGSFADAPYTHGMAGAHYNLLCAAVVARIPTSAVEHGLAALALFRAEGDTEGLGNTLRMLGMAYGQLGLYEQALELLLENLHLAEASGDPALVRNALNALGVVHDQSGNSAKALVYYRRTEQIVVEGEDHRSWRASINANMCFAHRVIGHHEAAIACGRRSLALFRALEHVNGQASAHENLGEAYLAAGRYTEALEHLTCAFDLASARGWNTAVHHLLLGKVHHAMGGLDIALEHVQQALAQADTADRDKLASQCHAELSALYEAQGDIQAALDHVRQQAALIEQTSQHEQRQRLAVLEIQHRTVLKQKESAFFQQRTAELERLRAHDRQVFERLMQMKDEAISTVLHDLKSPLHALQFTLDMLSSELDLDEPAQTKIDYMHRSIDKMAALISNLLDLAALETRYTPDTTPTPLGPLVAQAIRDATPHAARKRISLHAAADGPDPVITANTMRIQQVLDNLLSNAIKFTPDGGQITVTVVQDAGCVTVEVQDSGIGIPAEAQAYVFDRFFRVDDPAHQQVDGSGLGLHLVQRIVEAHGGQVWVRSTPGEGSTFGFTLPLEPPDSLRDG